MIATRAPAWRGLDERLLAVLLAATFGTGLVDAVSYLGLHKVFTANMTGNVVFIGLGLAGHPEIPVVRSVLALCGFLAGAGLVGRLQARTPSSTRVPRPTVVAFAVIPVVFAVLAAYFAVAEPGRTGLDVITIVLGLAMGGQACAARRLGIPDISTVVVTMTMAALAAESRLAGGAGERSLVRVLAVVAMLLGALAGASLLRIDLSLTLAVAAALSASVAIGVALVARSSTPAPVPQTANEGSR